MKINGKRLKRFMFIRAHREKTQSSCRERRRSIGLLKSTSDGRNREKVRQGERERSGRIGPDTYSVVLNRTIKYRARILC